jgi:nucleotide-binding universal stress UspA family protein
MKERILVGIDGSDRALDAARWAAHEAALRGASVHLVSAWEIPTALYGVGITDEEVDGLIIGAEQCLEAARKAVEEIATQVLVRAAEGAALLVVGSRGLGSFRELVLGSVGHYCAQHAPCPVVIVRGTATTGDEGR